MTNEQLAQLIATLISDFIRPNAQQHLESMQRLDRIEGVLDSHAEVIAGIDIKLDSAAALLQEVVKAQSVTAERLEDTRQLIAKNGSDIAQIGVRLEQLIEENQAFRESQQSQLAAIISNGQRITRIEQKAS